MSKEPVLIFDLVAVNKFTKNKICTEIRIRDNCKKTIRERVQNAYFTYDIVSLIPKQIIK